MLQNCGITAFIRKMRVDNSGYFFYNQKCNRKGHGLCVLFWNSRQLCTAEMSTERNGRIMKRSRRFKYVGLVCALTLLAGCGAPSSGGDGQTGRADETNGYITAGDAKSIVLENAGLSEEQIRFVRLHLDAEGGSAGYDIEFVSETAEYDYKLNAVTGEILSMNCEMGNFDLGNIGQQDIRQADNQVDLPSGEAADAQGGARGNAQGGAQAVPEDRYIGREAALQAALEHAGLDADGVRFIHAHLEFDDGRWQYDVEFHQGQEEYDYDIDAVTGEVLSYDHDADYSKPLSAAETGSERITEEAAKQLALEHAGVSGSDAKYLKVEFDYDDGRAEYEVEWYVGQMEYSCDIDAHTGEILSFKTERD